MVCFKQNCVSRAKTAILALVTFSLVLLGSTGVPAAGVSADEAAVVKGNTAFALKLYASLNKQKGNLIVSPYSVSSALAMTLAGAAGRTAIQMKRVLHLNLAPARLHRAFGAVQRRILAGQRWETNPRKRPGGWRLHLANALWPAQDLSLRPGFLKILRDNYGSTPRPQDYRGNAERARQNINDWVARQTKDKIKDLLAPGTVQPTTRLILTNAVYFKATWEEGFKGSSTLPRPFYLAPGRKIKAPTMYQTDVFGYAETPKLQVLEMAYQGKQLSMVVLLPRRKDGLARLERSLTPAALKGWLAAIKPRDVKVYLPRFKITARFGLGRLLKAMGMSLAFLARANFSRMSKPKGGLRFMISAVIHEAFIEVNEDGTEAAAATGVRIVATGVPPPGPPPPPPAVFKADHPFLFLVRDRRTGTILFLGRVVDPTK